MNSYSSLIKSNLDALKEGLSLLNTLGPAQYTASHQPVFLGTIGAHYRHLLEHYRCFLAQLEHNELCFDAREREAELENDLEYAKQTVSGIAQSLSLLEGATLEEGLEVVDQQTNQPVKSSVARELLFLQAHTVHHYAMIAAMARLLGLETSPDFGVAIATKAFNQQSCMAAE